MPMYDKLALGRKARELGFVRDTFEKMTRLTEFLQYINTEQELYRLLALKGGTAINLAIFNLPRLSVDIDLDFAENLPKDETAAKRERINEMIGRYNEIDSRESFRNESVVLVLIVVEGDGLAVIMVDTGSGDDGPAQISADVFDDFFWVRKSRFCIDIETVRAMLVDISLGFFERIADLLV